MARDMVREAVTAQCAELGADFALADTEFTTALTYAACWLVYEMVTACSAAITDATSTYALAAD